MALSMCIEFKAQSESDIVQPFSFQDHLNRYWLPLAKQHNFTLFQQLETIQITEESEARRLLDELESAHRILKSKSLADIPSNDAAYMAKRCQQAIDTIRLTLERWSAAKELSL